MELFAEKKYHWLGDEQGSSYNVILVTQPEPYCSNCRFSSSHPELTVLAAVSRIQIDVGHVRIIPVVLHLICFPRMVIYIDIVAVNLPSDVSPQYFGIPR